MLAFLLLALVALSAYSASSDITEAAIAPKVDLKLAAPVAQAIQPHDESPPPTLLTTTPANGSNWGGGPVVFAFDQEMDESSAASLSIAPPLPGDVAAEGSDVVFSPAQTPEPNVRYRLMIDSDASSVSGAMLNAPVEISLVGIGPLEVTDTQPSDGAEQVAIDGQIVVSFNRPVVALAGLDAAQPNPLTITPPVAGQGDWTSTSVYVFQPEPGLVGATEYQITVDDLTGLGGETLDAPYTFSFETTSPTVTEITPAGEMAPPDAQVQVTFSQSMDAASTEAAFTLRLAYASIADSISGTFAWDETSSELTFSPDAPLEMGANYLVEVGRDAQTADLGGNLRELASGSFTVIPLPAVLATSPFDGERNVDPERTVTVQFSAPVSRTQVLEEIDISPPITSSYVYSYYAEWNNELQLSWFKDANTRYTITLGSAIEDQFGNSLGDTPDDDYAFSFTTGDYAPFAHLSLDRFTHFGAYTDTLASLLYRNMDEVVVSLYRLPTSEFLKLTGENQWQVWNGYQLPEAERNRIWTRRYEPYVGPNVTARQVVTLTDTVGERLQPGLYFLEVEQPAQDEEFDGVDRRDQSLIVLSNDQLVLKKSSQGRSMAWLTDLVTGEPVADQTARFYVKNELRDGATTDSDGLASVELALDNQEGWAPVVAISGEPGDEHFAAVSSEWSQGIAVWDFGLSGGFGVEEMRNHFYTDRPIYRPGQVVHWKGILRTIADDQLALPPRDLVVNVVARDDRGNAVYQVSLSPNAYGTVNGAFTLPPDAFTGFYFLEAQVPLGPERIAYSGSGFQVASYQKPEFEIEVDSEEPEYIQGDTVRFDAMAAYFSGGPLADAPLTWRVIAEPYTFRWEDAPDDRFYSFDPFDPAQVEYDPFGGFYYGGLIHESEGVTDAEGKFSIELPADLEESPASQRWIFDVTIQSPTNQFVSGSVVAPVHRAEFYIGISPQSYVVQTGDEAGIDLVAITPEGDPYPGAEVEVIISEFKWNSVYEQAADGSYYWQTSVERTPLLTTAVTTDRDGAAQIAWTPEGGGQYQIKATGADDRGNAVGSVSYLWVSGNDFVAWPRENNDRIELVADKDLYAPGDMARILTPSPFAGPVRAWLTLERGGVLESQLITLDGNSETLEIPITADHIPNIYVSVVLAAGVDETNPLPAMRIGYVQLNVDTSEKELAVEIEPSADVVRPRDMVSYTLRVLDSAGDPAPNTEVSVALVDKSVLSLSAGGDQKLLDVFYYQQPLGVSTGALLVINQDRVSQQLSEGAKGGGGGGLGAGPEVRDEFPDSAYWRAELVSDENGEIRFSVPLPDNLTTWTLTAKGVNPETQVGESVADVVATKELQLRALLPRFFTAGDRAKIGASILNTSDAAVDNGQLSIIVEGAAVEGGDPTVDFALDAGAQTTESWPIAVDPTSSAVTVTFVAASSTLSDALRITLPVHRYETPETVATSGQVPPEGQMEAIYLPDGATDNGELLVTVEGSLAAGMVDSLDFLRHYPYECTEQAVSRFLPNVMTARALRDLGLDDDDLESDLAYQLGIGAQKLISRQNGDGGWGYWSGEESSLFVSAYVLWGLANADTIGFPVPKMTLSAAVDYLDRNFQAPKDVESDWQLNEMAFMHFTLSEMGQGDPGRASTLFDARERLALYGQAFLAMALDNMSEEGVDDPRVTTLLDDLIGQVDLTGSGASWHEESVDWWTLSSDTRTTAIVLAALARLDPQQPLLPNVVRWLMVNRSAGAWSTTQENAWSLIALTDWLVASGELNADYDWLVLLNADEWDSGAVDADNLAEPVRLRKAVADLLRDQANVLRFDRTDGPGNLYYTTHLRYFLDALAVDAVDRGVVVERRFEVGDEASSRAASRAAVGDVVSVTVNIVAPTDLHHLLVEVPLPAGLEAIDPSLATTSNQFEGPQFSPLDAPDLPLGWQKYWLPTSTDIRDEKVALFSTRLPAGSYEYTFQARASVPGEYRVLPVHAEQMYFPGVWGRSAGELFSVVE